MRLQLVPPQQFITIPEGAAGTRATLKHMARLVRMYKTDPGIHMRARDIVSMSPQGDYTSEVSALFQFVRDNIRYIQDVTGMEELHAPDELLISAQGDCDDKSTLLATLLESVGHKARFIAVGYSKPNDFEHVFVETKIGPNWIGLETTPIDGHMVEMGWSPVPPNIDRPLMAYMVEWI